MERSEVIIWIAAGLLGYCYFGYGMLLWVINKIRAHVSRRPGMQGQYDDHFTPPVTLIVAAYNEDNILEQKIRNILQLDYPPSQLNVIFVTDGSTDGSLKLLQQYPEILILHLSGRKGKTAAINRAMQYVQTDFVVFSDANAMLNTQALKFMMRHFADPCIGGVAGEKRIFNPSASAIGTAEGLYWRYESFLKKQESDFDSVIGAAGELFAIRTALYHHPGNDIILDDLMISVDVCLRGYRFVYEDQAFATEGPSSSLRDEQVRKTRIAAGVFQAMPYLLPCLNFLQHRRLAFQFFSKRFLRWFICPLALLVIFISHLWLIDSAVTNLYNYLFLVQVVFYEMAAIGWLLIRKGRLPAVCTIPFYVTFMNACLYSGFLKVVRNQHTVLWKKALREVVE